MRRPIALFTVLAACAAAPAGLVSATTPEPPTSQAPAGGGDKIEATPTTDAIADEGSAPSLSEAMAMEDSAIFPASAMSPDSLGGSAIFNALASYCQAGAMNACTDLYSGAPYDSAYEDYGRTCGGRQSADTFESCSDLLTSSLVAADFTPTAATLAPGEYFDDEFQPGIYVSGAIQGEYCSWNAHDEWGYTTNSGFVGSDGLSQAVAAVMVLPADRTLNIDSDCGPLALVEAWSR